MAHAQIAESYACNARRGLDFSSIHNLNSLNWKRETLALSWRASLSIAAGRACSSATSRVPCATTGVELPRIVAELGNRRVWRQVQPPLRLQERRRENWPGTILSSSSVFPLISTYIWLEPPCIFAVCAQPFCSPPEDANASTSLTAESRPYRLSLHRSSHPSRGLLSARYRISRSPGLLELPISIVLTGLTVID
jgi:hypothetical protein